MMNVESQTRTRNGAKFVMLKEDEARELLKEIEFRLGSWQELQQDYSTRHNAPLPDRALDGFAVIWMTYKGMTVYSQVRAIYEQEYRQNDLIFRKVLNALTKMATSYDMLELYEFARWGELLREHLIEIGMLKKGEDI